jgi:hypothetical protein
MYSIERKKKMKEIKDVFILSNAQSNLTRQGQVKFHVKENGTNFDFNQIFRFLII